MPNLDELLAKEHVKNHPLFKKREERIARQRRNRDLRAQMLEQEENDSLNDIFSNGGGSKKDDRSLPDFIRSAIRVTENLLKQFNFPLYPKISYNNTKNIKYAAHDEGLVVDGSILLNCQIKTLNGLNKLATISVPINKGEVVTPAVMEIDGRLYTIGQSSIDRIVERHTAYETEPLRNMYDPPLNEDERVMAVENKYDMGYRPRESGNIFDTTKRGRASEMHGAYQLIVDEMYKAQADGTDTFPRQWSHLAERYILPVIGVASPDSWMNQLINDGFCINPYGVNRGRPTTTAKRKSSKHRRQSSEKVDMFGMYNDTDKFALLVDGYFQLFDTAEETKEAYYSMLDADGEIEGTPFGSIEALPPGKGSGSPLSEYTPSDLDEYKKRSEEDLLARVEEERKRFEEEDSGAFDYLFENSQELRDIIKSKRGRPTTTAKRKNAGSPGKFEGVPDEYLELAESLYGETPDEEAGDIQENGIWYGFYSGPFEFEGEVYGGVILSEDEAGFVDLEVFEGPISASEKWESIEREISDFQGETFSPSEDDGFITDSSRGGYSVSYAGRHLGDFDDRDEAEDALREQMEKGSYWPNVWFVSDHGNISLIEDFYGKEASKKAQIDDDTAIYDYLEKKWDYLEKQGWDPSVGKDMYIKRNFPYVKQNLEDNPDYLDEAYGKLRESKKAQQFEDEDFNDEEILDSIDVEPRMYPETKTPMEHGDGVKFNGNEGPIKGKILEIDPEDDYIIIESKGLRYQVHCEDIEALPSTFGKMWK